MLFAIQWHFVLIFVLVFLISDNVSANGFGKHAVSVFRVQLNAANFF